MGLPSLFENILEKASLEEIRQAYLKRMKSSSSESLKSAYRNRDISHVPNQEPRELKTLLNDRIFDEKIQLYNIAFYQDGYHMILQDNLSGALQAVDEEGVVRTISKMKCQIVPFEAKTVSSRARMVFTLIRALHKEGRIEMVGGEVRLVRCLTCPKTIQQKQRIAGDLKKDARKTQRRIAKRNKNLAAFSTKIS